MFVEFESELSITKIPKIAEKSKLEISKKFHLAGTNTFSLIRKSKRS